MILLWMWSTAAPFLKGSGLQAVPGMGWLGETHCSLPCETVGRHWTDRAKLGQITASKPGKKKQCRQGAIVVSPILGDVAVCAGAGLDFCLISWEKYIIYWHYFANYFNAIFISALNNKPKLFVKEEEDICSVSSRTPKHSPRSRLSSPRSSLVNELLQTALSLFLPRPPPFPSWTSSTELSLCYHSGCWWTITLSSSLMRPHGPRSSLAVGENSPPPSHQQDQDPGLARACVSIRFRALQPRNWGLAATEVVSSEDFKHS